MRKQSTTAYWQKHKHKKKQKKTKKNKTKKTHKQLTINLTSTILKMNTNEL